ncbi:hypothetical protein M947_01925 [Sulfurimonas hongkongensis]|uniref:NarX-like N-terminal domain-containing protein n=1 Tax=Sulfurimonas hongkongensis TaxID=1172190 RepID=T0JQY9_9BACT|nr:hypothetical protein [Sulfurimonas hongkongensis]EQB40586.1 hypothetical protein M947_01925 [Sulfurimonas hongkongensis]
MTNIKVVGILIFILSITLALLSSQISKQNSFNNDFLDLLNSQKAFTQDIAKNIFFVYRYRDSSTKELDKSIKAFVKNMENREFPIEQKGSLEITQKTRKITKLWNEFYLLVQNFRDKAKTTSPYSTILLEKMVNDIYHANIKLVMEFDELIKMHKTEYEKNFHSSKSLQYTLFLILVVLLVYLFTQLKELISFIQKFLSTSKKIITNSSIKDLEPIKMKNESKEILQARNNFNLLVEKINSSIENSSHSIEHSFGSLYQVESNITDLLELIYTMQGTHSIDKELTKREDALIDSLEELTTSAKRLEDLKKDLNSLISSSILKS